MSESGHSSGTIGIILSICTVHRQASLYVLIATNGDLEVIVLIVCEFYTNRNLHPQKLHHLDFVYEFTNDYQVIIKLSHTHQIFPNYENREINQPYQICLSFFSQQYEESNKLILRLKYIGILLNNAHHYMYFFYKLYVEKKFFISNLIVLKNKINDFFSLWFLLPVQFSFSWKICNKHRSASTLKFSKIKNQLWYASQQKKIGII